MDIIIVGAQKAGTSWLYSMLKQQPRIGVAFRKELHYFDRICNDDVDHAKYLDSIWHRQNKFKILFSSKQRKYIERAADRRIAFTDAWYRSLFIENPENKKRTDRGEKLVYLEATPAYMTMPKKSITRMASALPDITPIMLVRDPVKRMISGLSMILTRRPERQQRSLKEHFRVLRDKQVTRGDYARAIPLFRQEFSHLHIVPFGRIVKDSGAVMREIEDIYDLDKIKYKFLTTKKNSHTGKVQLNDQIREEINILCAPQYEYLKHEFGASFLKDI